MITQAPRGTKDWFGKDMDQRTYLENIFKDLCASYNIHEIITPVFEHTELFLRKFALLFLNVRNFLSVLLEIQQMLSRKRCIHLKIKDTEAFH